MRGHGTPELQHAVERGELLKGFNAQGRRSDQAEFATSVAPQQKSQEEAAREAGLSDHQRRTAVAIAAIRAETSEEAVDSILPPRRW